MVPSWEWAGIAGSRATIGFLGGLHVDDHLAGFQGLSDLGLHCIGDLMGGVHVQRSVHGDG